MECPHCGLEPTYFRGYRRHILRLGHTIIQYGVKMAPRVSHVWARCSTHDADFLVCANCQETVTL